ncbi:hypothetical protein [Cryobacterium sp. M23]|uniref:hypothetical protein n=1 Tax=Cryobacterium sp. M23 TaxID=2048292 RepID=UPI000CE41DE5|nr:hypothetical protein [Cryobacterium sp. M23]
MFTLGEVIVKAATIIDPWISIWISIVAAAFALLAAIATFWMGFTAYGARPDKGKARMLVVGSEPSTGGGVYNGWTIENVGNGVAVNPHVSFKNPFDFLSEKTLTATVAGQLTPNGSLPLALCTNWPSPKTLNTNGGLAWPGYTGTVTWSEPGGRERTAEIKVFIDLTKPEAIAGLRKRS